MERKEALELLRAGPSGVSKWNEWREKQGQHLELPNLSHANLEGIQLAEVDLRDVNLLSANLRGANLRRAALARAKLAQAFLEDADLRGAHLDQAILSGADLRGTNLDGASLREADLSGTDLKGAHLLRARMASALLVGADLRGAYMRSTYLRQANMSGCKLDGAHLRGAYLRGADLRDASLDGVYWRDAILDEEMMRQIHLLPNHLPVVPLDLSLGAVEHESATYLAFGRVRLDGPVNLARLAQIIEKIHHLSIAAFRYIEAPRTAISLDAIAHARVGVSSHEDERPLVGHGDFWRWLSDNEPARALRHSRTVIVRQLGLTHDGGLELACDVRCAAGLAVAMVWILVVDALRRAEVSAYRLPERDKMASSQALVENLRQEGVDLGLRDAGYLVADAVLVLRTTGVQNVSSPRIIWLREQLLRLRLNAPVGRVDHGEVLRNDAI